MSTPAKKKTVILITVICLVVIGFASAVRVSSSDRTCVTCHEIRPAHEMWAQSSHREAPCVECHGSILSNGWHSLWENTRKLAGHFAATSPEDIRMTEEHVAEMIIRCKRCHEREYAGWLASGHSLTYADVLLNEKHNREEQLNDDCLRCHCMFYEGRIEDIVTPISIQGPWKLTKRELSRRPAIPCLACHEIHLKGNPATRPDYADPKTIASRRDLRPPKLSFYDRREKAYFAAALLPEPGVAEGDRLIGMAPDNRQRVCVQCHAPNGRHESATADDRTPKGVHEGLSCIACHAIHSLETRRSCAECHPSLSNCGRDVEKMDTTYFAPVSRQNIHFVKCADCHVKGVPARRKRAS